MAVQPKRQKVRDRSTNCRTSNNGCLPMTLLEYLQLLEWTGRQLHTGKRGRISRGHPSYNEVNFCYPPYRCVTIWLSFQNLGTPMARINRREGNACGATHTDAWFCDEITINCSVNCQKKVGWPQLNAFSDTCDKSHLKKTHLPSVVSNEQVRHCIW